MIEVMTRRTTDHGIGVAGLHHQGGNDGRVFAGHDLRLFGRDTVVPHFFVIKRPKGGELAVVFGIENSEILARCQAQTKFRDQFADRAGAADQDRPAELVINQHLGGAQHPFVLALHIDHPFGIGPSLLEHRLHGHAGFIDKALQGLAIGMEIGDGPFRDAAVHGCLCHRRRDLQYQAGIERLWDQVVPAKGQGLAHVGLGHHFRGFRHGQICDGVNGGPLHRFIDLGRAAIQRASKQIGETQHIVDLVGIVGSARGHYHVVTGGMGELRQNLRIGIGQGQDHRLVRHGFDHFPVQNVGPGHAQEHVRALDGIGQGAVRGVFFIDLLGGIYAAFPAHMDHALAIGDVNIFNGHSEADQKVQRGDGRRPRAGGHHLDQFQIFADKTQAVDQGSADTDGGAVLIIVKNRDLHACFQPVFDLEALRRLDILQVDAAKCRLQGLDDFDELVRIPLVYLDIENVDAGEFLEQDAFALHHRFGRQRTGGA